MKNKLLFNLMLMIAVVSAVIAINILAAAPAFALSLCDGCPLQEVCSDTTEGVEVLSCDNNVVPGAPALMGNAAQLINEEAAAETQEAAIAPASMTTQEAAVTSNAVTGEAAAAAHPAPAAQQAVPLNEFAALNAYQTTGETFLIITLKGDSALLEKFSRIITDKYSIKDGRGEGCELIMATAEEFTIKISRETEKDKLDFMESQGVNFSK